MLLSLYIVNKAGGLIFHYDYSFLSPKLSSNDHLRLGSTFHSVHAISGLIGPVSSALKGGIRSLETDTFKLQCFQSLTGIKFFITAECNSIFAELELFLQSVYEIYTDYVLKNPFYELEMPIRCSRFNIKLKELVDKTNSEITKRIVP